MELNRLAVCRPQGRRCPHHDKARAVRHDDVARPGEACARRLDAPAKRVRRVQYEGPIGALGDSLPTVPRSSSRSLAARFGSSGGTPIRRTASRRCSSARRTSAPSLVQQKLGLRMLSHHGVGRHSVASQAVTGGESVKAVQAQLGHRSEQSTHQYAHLGAGAQRRLVAALQPARAPHKGRNHVNVASTGAPSGAILEAHVNVASTSPRSLLEE